MPQRSENVRGKKYNDDVKEKAMALLATNNSLEEVSKQTGLPMTTIATWKQQKKDDPEFVALRSKKKAEFVDAAWKNIENANKLLDKRIVRALEAEDEIDAILEEVKKLDDKELSNEKKREIAKKLSAVKIEDVGKIATVLGTLYDKQALANNEPTMRAEVKLEDLLKKVEGDEY